MTADLGIYKRLCPVVSGARIFPPAAKRRPHQDVPTETVTRVSLDAPHQHLGRAHAPGAVAIAWLRQRLGSAT